MGLAVADYLGGGDAGRFVNCEDAFAWKVGHGIVSCYCGFGERLKGSGGMANTHWEFIEAEVE